MPLPHFHLLSSLQIPQEPLISFNFEGEPVLTITKKKIEYLNNDGDLLVAKDEGDILEAFEFCVLHMTDCDNLNESMINKFCEKIDNNEISIKQLGQIEKIIRKKKLEKLNRAHL